MIPEQLTKLPKWAQREVQNMHAEIESLKKQRDVFLSDQRISPVYVDQGFPDTVRRYINSDSVYVEHVGIKLEVVAVREEVRLYWEVVPPRTFDDYVTFVPRAANTGYFIRTRQIKE